MKIIYFGTPDWAVPALDAVLAAGHDVTLVITAPDAAQGRSRTPQPPPVKRRALELGVPLLQPATLRDAAAREAILASEPDALVVVAYGRILPGRLIDATRLGPVNVHFSLLPRHRGASPVQHTLLAGDAHAGVTTMRMERGLDTGPVLLTWSTPIGAREDAVALGARLAAAGAPLLVETLARLADGSVVPRPQDDAAATWAPPLTRAMGLVDWNDAALVTERKVRAFAAWPPVTCGGARGPLRLVEVEALDCVAPRGTAPGASFARHGDALDVACGAGSVLRLHRVQPAGGRPMPAAAALAGRHLEFGTPLAPGASA